MDLFPLGVAQQPTVSRAGVSGDMDKLIGGWKVSAQQSYNSGRPLSLTMNNNLSGLLFGAKRPDKIGPGVNPNFVNPQTPYLLKSGWTACNNNDPNALCLGNAARTDPRIRGFGCYHEDLNVYKDTHINERAYVRFEAQAGNVLNRVDFCPPVTNWSSGSFGTVSSQCNIARVIQFGLTINY